MVGPKHTLAQPSGEGTYLIEQYVDRMDLAYAAADAVLCRAGSNTVTEVSGVGLPAVYVPLPIGNGEQALNARPVVDAGGGLLVADAALTPEWVAATIPALLNDRARLDRHGRGCRPRGAARRRREAGADDPPGRLAMRVPVPDVLLPADQLGRVHFIGIGGAGLSAIARIMARNGIEVSGSDDQDTPFLPALRELGVTCHLGYDAEHLGASPTPTPSSSPRPHARTTSRSPRPVGAVCGCCPARPGSPPPWPATASSPSPAPTARPPRPAC